MTSGAAMEAEDGDETLRAALREAIRECRRQIEILKTPARGSARRNGLEIALLEKELGRLRDALAGLGGAEE